MLIIGFDAVGWDIVEQMICNTRFSTSNGGELPFSCTVIDSDSRGWEEFKAYCPDAETCYNLRFERHDVAESDFPSWVADRLDLFNRIIVCSADSDTNVELLSRIERAARNALKDRLFNGDVLPRIFVRVENAETKNCVEAVRLQRTEAGRNLYGVTRFFGCLEDIYRTDFLNYDTLYDVASVLNARHMNNGNMPKVGNGWLCRSKACERRVIDACWVRASFDDRMSSLSSAAGERNALMLMGYSVVEKVGGKSNVGGDLEALRRRLANENTLDRLARNEHYRWNAWHRMRGYRTWDLVNPPIDDEKVKKANKLSVFGRHADIVAYDDLPEVDRRILRAVSPEDAERASPEQFRGDGSYAVRGEERRCAQYWDREFCRSIADHIAAAGCTVVSAPLCAGSNVGREGKGRDDAN